MVRVLPRLIWLAVVVAAVILCFIPLFDLLGLESALVMGVVLGLASLALTAHAIGSGQVPRPLASERTVSPSGDFFRLLPRHLALLLPTAGILALNAVRVRNCDPLTGLLFWLLIPAVSVVIGQSLAWLAAAVARRPSVQGGVAVAILLADLAWFGWRLAWEPSIMGYTLLLGWFPGSLYDEAAQLTPTLLWYRLLCLMACGVVLLSVELLWRRRSGHRQAPWAWGLAVVGASLAAAWLVRGELGLHLDKADVIEALGATVESEHFTIHYDPQRIDAEHVSELIEDHEFRYAELVAFTGEDPVSWKGRKLTSFVYPDRETQFRLMGSRRTLVARPWTHEMHVRWTRIGDSILAHELAHLFSAPFGAGPGRLATRDGSLRIDLGMVEGFATAADWGPGTLTAHEATAAMRRLGIAPDLRAIFRPAGFWSQPSGKAYTLMGSFVRWLIEVEGIESYKRVYGGADWSVVYGRSATALVTEWESWVDGLELRDAELEYARHRYRRRSIFQKVCARTLAELDRKAERAEARLAFDEARRLREEILSHQPGRPDHALALARLHDLEGDSSAALAVLDELLARDGLQDGMRAEVRELRGDIRWRAGAGPAAVPDYEACLATGVAESTRRELLVKAQVLGAADPLVEPLARRYMVERTGAAAALYLALRWRAAAPSDPLPRYLVGLQLLRAEEYGDAADALDGTDGPLTDPLLEEQRQLLLVVALVRLGRFDEALAVVSVLERSPRSSRSVWAREYRDRISFLRAWPGFTPWTPRGPPR